MIYHKYFHMYKMRQITLITVMDSRYNEMKYFFDLSIRNQPQFRWPQFKFHDLKGEISWH